MPNWKVRVSLLCASLAIAAPASLTLAGAAQATPTWLPPERRSGEGASFADAAMAEDGAAAVAWVSTEGKTIYVTTRGGFGGFGLPVALPSEGALELRDPQVGVDGAGAATTVWVDAQRGEIESATDSAGMAGAHQQLSVPSATVGEPGEVVSEPELAVAEDGAAVAAWRRVNGSRSVVEAAYRSTEGGFGAPSVISETETEASKPAVAIDAEGESVIAWQDAGRIEIRGVASHYIGPATRTISAPGEEASAPAVAIDGPKDAALAWIDTTGSIRSVVADVEPEGGPGPKQVAPGASEAARPSVGVDAAGAATVAWTTTFAGSEAIDVADAPASGSFSPPQTVAYGARFPSLAVNGDGGAMLGYLAEAAGGSTYAGASYRPAGGAFGAQTAVSPSEA
ncbi:MAG: hypothetical protein ACYCSI_13775, partial [Solirubrobacteraceae bacterium]